MTRLQQRCLLISLALHGALLGALALAALVTASRRPVERPALVFDLQREPATAPGSRGGDALVAGSWPRRPAARFHEQIKSEQTPETAQAPRTLSLAKAPANGPGKIAVAKPVRNTALSAQALAPVVRPRTGAGQGSGTGSPVTAPVGAARTGGIAQKSESPHPVEAAATNVMHGGTGLSVESYAGQVRSAYAAAWLPPEELTDQKAVAEVEVVVKRDGSVVSAEILTGSRNVLMDRSVRQALNEVQFIREFPADWREEQKTFRIRFDLSVREQLLAG